MRICNLYQMLIESTGPSIYLLVCISVLHIGKSPAVFFWVNGNDDRYLIKFSGVNHVCMRITLRLSASGRESRPLCPVRIEFLGDYSNKDYDIERTPGALDGRSLYQMTISHNPI